MKEADKVSLEKAQSKLFLRVKKPGRVIVLLRGEARKVSAIIDAPDSVRSERPQEGMVVAAHPDSPWKPGETMVFTRYALDYTASPASGTGIEFAVVREDDALCEFDEAAWARMESEAEAAAEADIAASRKRHADMNAGGKLVDDA